jgi:GrpB-like predicted nucleotidyltransferase (UPF0157 family)
MHNTGMSLSDVLTGYVNGKPVDSELWQSLDESERSWLAHATVAAKTKAMEVWICDYDPEWPHLFSRIERELREHVGTLAVAIEHVGSTSVPGLAAKPIIDLDIVIASAYQFPSIKERLEKFGYIHEGPCGVPDREAFRCVIDLPPHHLYVCESGARPLQEHVCFRDILRRSPELAAEYAELKRTLAERYRHDRATYGEAKTSFVRSVITGPSRVVG